MVNDNEIKAEVSPFAIRKGEIKTLIDQVEMEEELKKALNIR